MKKELLKIYDYLFKINDLIDEERDKIDTKASNRDSGEYTEKEEEKLERLDNIQILSEQLIQEIEEMYFE